jgi:hypothetical protein
MLYGWLNFFLLLVTTGKKPPIFCDIGPARQETKFGNGSNVRLTSITLWRRSTVMTDHSKPQTATYSGKPTEKFLEKWVKDLETFYPNRGDQVIEWRRIGARELFLSAQQKLFCSLRNAEQL